jgi:hypothetical protein
MTPKGRCKEWCGHTSSWHRELVGPELQSVLQADHPQHAGGLQREQRFHVPQHWMPRLSRRGALEHTRSALHSIPMHGSPLGMPRRHREARMQLLLFDGEPRSPSWNRRATCHRAIQASGQTSKCNTSSARHAASPCRRYSNRGVHGGTGERETPATAVQMVLASLPATTGQAETVAGTTSKTPTTAETKEKATTKAAEQGNTTPTAVAAPPAAPSTT